MNKRPKRHDPVLMSRATIRKARWYQWLTRVYRPREADDPTYMLAMTYHWNNAYNCLDIVTACEKYTDAELDALDREYQGQLEADVAEIDANWAAHVKDGLS